MDTENLIRVAVASDQAIFRRGLMSLLVSLKGIQMVGEAADAEEAMQLAELVKPDVLLVDLKGALQNGRDVAFAARERWPLLKVVCLLNSLQESELQADFDPDGPYYFSKDVSEDEFVSALQRIGHNLPDSESHPIVGSDARPVTADQAAAGRELEGKNIARELHMAGRIQADILPEKPPALRGWDISARLISARSTSGDFYDFIPVANNNWAVVIADVTDKGMGAALFMALTSTLIRTFAVRYPTLPALTMDAVNERIFKDTRGNMFVTAFYGVLEPHTGRFRFTNAGHPPAYLLSTQKGKPVDRLRPTGMALGMLESAHWGQKIVRMAPGDVLLVFTDGVTEAENERGDFFEEQRIMDILRAKSTASAREIQDALLEAVQKHIGESTHRDDVAVLVIKRRQ